MDLQGYCWQTSIMPPSHHWRSLLASAGVLVLSVEFVLPRILVTDTDGAPLASRVGTGPEQ